MPKTKPIPQRNALLRDQVKHAGFELFAMKLGNKTYVLNYMADPFYMTVPDNKVVRGHSRSNSSDSIASTMSYSSQELYPITSTGMEDCLRKSRKRSVSAFVSKLFRMVCDEKYQQFIYWNSNGTSFFVHQATQLAQEILPEHFKHSNFSSFVRQLNMYGFHKINKSPRGARRHQDNEVWEFTHPSFQNGRPDLLENIKRRPMEREMLRRESSDMQSSFALVQLSHSDLLQQFQILQESCSNLTQAFEEMKHTQMQQQMIMNKILQHQKQVIQAFAPQLPLTDNTMVDRPGICVTTPNSMETDGVLWPSKSAQPNADLAPPYAPLNSMSPPSPVSPIYVRPTGEQPLLAQGLCTVNPSLII